jgi:hypothetical protein
MSDESNDTAQKLPQAPGKPFKKGYDPRRNLRGVPKEAIEMRKMLRKIAAELIKIRDEGGNEYEVTRLYARARLAFSSRNPRELELILKAMYPGLLKDEVDLKSYNIDLSNLTDHQLERIKKGDNLIDVLADKG